MTKGKELRSSVSTLREHDARELARVDEQLQVALSEHRAAKARAEAAQAEREAASGTPAFARAREAWIASVMEFKRAEQRANELHELRSFAAAVLRVTEAVEIRLCRYDCEYVRRQVRMLVMPLAHFARKGGEGWVKQAPENDQWLADRSGFEV